MGDGRPRGLYIQTSDEVSYGLISHVQTLTLCHIFITLLCFFPTFSCFHIQEYEYEKLPMLHSISGKPFLLCQGWDQHLLMSNCSSSRANVGPELCGSEVQHTALCLHSLCFVPSQRVHLPHSLRVTPSREERLLPLICPEHLGTE